MEPNSAIFLIVFVLQLESVSAPIIENYFNVSEDPEDIRFYLYPSPSNLDFKEDIIFQNLTSLKASSFNKNTKTIFLVHGFWANRTSHFPMDVKNAYLNWIPNQNYIIVDWGPLAISNASKAEQLYPLVYLHVVRKSLPIVSKRIADFVTFLIQANYTSLDRIHLIGHSLGAVIVGNTGNILQSIKSEGSNKNKVKRITGLDPAGPLFDLFKFHKKLTKEDGEFVDAYHTAMGPFNYGDYSVDGHVDFYPNGGIKQPSCEDHLSPFDPFGHGACSHQFVIDIYIATISKKIVACECNPFINLILIYKCGGNCSAPIFAGEPCPSHARGLYHFKTSDKP